MAVSSKYTQDLSVQIVFFMFSCKWFLCFYFWAVIWSYIVDLFAALHELASASVRCTKACIIGARALKTLWRHLKSNFKRETVDGVVRAQNWGGDRKKCIAKVFKKRSITFKDAWLPLLFML